MAIQLWAKSKFRDSDDTPPTVRRHCQDVHAAAQAVWTSIRSDLADAVGDPPESLPRLMAVAALLHDLMKANSAFQKMVHENSRTFRQPVRHEILAATLLSTEGPLATWFAQTIPNEKERWAVIWAIAGHHLRMIDPARSPNMPLYRDSDVAETLTVYSSHEDVKALLTQVGRCTISLADLSFGTADDDANSLRERVAAFVNLSFDAWNEFRTDMEFKKAVAFLKAFLIASDVAASAVTVQKLKTEDWIARSLLTRLLPSDLDTVIIKGTKGVAIRDFQTAVGKSEKFATIVVAGCGNGKTTAAYLWAKRHAAGRKLFFTYPTTGTATAGFASHLADQHELLAELIHSKREVDLAAIRTTAEVTRRDEIDRIDSLRTWDRKVVVCTVDTVLGLLQTQRKALYSFPAFISGAFVFDEIHSYDSRLFGSLLRFLKEFPGVRALLMSASIPPERLRLLSEVLGSRVGEVIHGDETLEGHKRYQFRSRESANACRKDVNDALRERKKVLWVCNTVGDAIAEARQARGWAEVIPIVYHSRFRYCDREARQRELISAFRETGKPVFAITTQVCEMSLDISANLMVSAECPFPALVQRLGRLNRFAESDDPWPCLVFPFQGLPYNERPERIDLDGDYRASMAVTRDFVSSWNGKPCSQKDLSDELRKLIESEDPKLYSAWLDDGWLTEPMPVRDSDQSITVIRVADIDCISEMLGTDRHKWPASKLIPWTIPMNYRRGIKFEESVGPYPLASDEILSYSETEGAEWKKT